MTIHTRYGVRCDGCYFTDSFGWREIEHAEAFVRHNNWVEEAGFHYCPACAPQAFKKNCVTPIEQNDAQQKETANDHNS